MIKLSNLIVLILLLSLFTSTFAQQKTSQKGKKEPMKKTLVVSYSLTGNTKRVADDIASRLNADTENIIDKKNRKGFWAFFIAGRDSSMKHLTEIGEIKNNPSNYDIIVIGTPVWAWNMTPAIRTYITKYKDSIKQVAFFTTSGGTKPDKIIDKMEQLLGKKSIASTGFVSKELNLKNKDVYDKKLEEFITKVK